jgi:hypothetical protein
MADLSDIFDAFRANIEALEAALKGDTSGFVYCWREGTSGGVSHAAISHIQTGLGFGRPCAQGRTRDKDLFRQTA